MSNQQQKIEFPLLHDMRAFLHASRLMKVSCTSIDGCCCGFCNVVTEDGESIEFAKSTLPELIKVELEFEGDTMALKTTPKYLHPVEETPLSHLSLPIFSYGSLLCD